MPFEVAKSTIWPWDVIYFLKAITKSFPPSEFFGPNLFRLKACKLKLCTFIWSRVIPILKVSFLKDDLFLVALIARKQTLFCSRFYPSSFLASFGGLSHNVKIYSVIQWRKSLAIVSSFSQKLRLQYKQNMISSKPNSTQHPQIYLSFEISGTIPDITNMPTTLYCYMCI